MYTVHRLVLTILKQPDLHPGHRHYYRPRTKEEEKLSWRIRFTVKWPQTRVMSPEIYSQVTRNVELYNYVAKNFYPAQQHPQGFLLHIYHACFVSLEIREQNIVLTYHVYFVAHQGLRENKIITHLYYLFHLMITLKNEVCYTFLPLVLSHDGLWWYLSHGSKWLESKHNKITYPQNEDS